MKRESRTVQTFDLRHALARTAACAAIGLSGLLFATAPAHAAVTVNKTFSPSSMTVDGTSTVTITLGNTGSNPATGTAFTDTLPAGLVIASPSNVATTCGGTASATPGSDTVSLSGGTIPPSGGSCTVTAEVTADALGNYTNTIPAGDVTSSEGSNGSPASTTLAVIAAQPVTGSIAFSPAGTALRGHGPALAATITLNNSNTMALTDVLMTFNLDAEYQAFASPANLSSTCGPVALDTAAGTGTLSGGTIPAGSCTITFDIVAAAPDVFTDQNTTITIAAGNLTSAQGITNNAVSGLILTRTGGGLTKTFLPTVVASGGTSTLTLRLDNMNAAPITPVDLTDTFPAGMTVAPTPDATNDCGGTLTANAGAGSIELSGGTLEAAPTTGTSFTSCTITVDVVGTNTGTTNLLLTNTIPAGDWDGIGHAATAANLTVTPGGSVLKSFSPTTISTGGVSTLSVELNNFTADAISPVDLTDTLPAGVTVAAAPNVTNTCGGTITAAPGAGSVQLSGGSLAAAPSQGTPSSCVFTVDVTATDIGTYPNTIPGGDWNGVSYLGGSATLTVSQAFSATKHIANRAYGPRRLTFAGFVQAATITLTNNTNSPSVPITVTSLTDDLTTMGTGFAVASDPVPSTTCAGGMVDAPAGATTLIMTGGTIPASGSCTITFGIYFPLHPDTLGTRTNTIAAGNIETDAGSNAAAVGFGVLIFSPLTINKSFTPAAVNAGGTSRLNIALGYRNDGNGVGVDTMTNISGTDPLPAGMVVATPPAIDTTCDGAMVTAPEGGSTVDFTGANLEPGEDCTISVDVFVLPETPSGVLNNVIAANSLTTDQGVTNSTRTTGGGNFGDPAARANLTVANTNLTINKTFTPSNVAVGEVSQLAINFVNTNPEAITLTQAALTDELPSGMVVANPAGATFASPGCVGTVGATPGESSVTLSNAQINAGVTCTLRVNVVSSAAGNQINTVPAGALTSAQGVTNTSSTTATLAVSGTADLGITKTNDAAEIVTGTATTYTIVVSNAGPDDVAGAMVTDTPPSGMTFTSWTCEASAGASCGEPSGSGPIDDTINVDVGATVTYTVQALVAHDYSDETITNTATITPPALVADPTPDDNQADDTDTVITRTCNLAANGSFEIPNIQTDPQRPGENTAFVNGWAVWRTTTYPIDGWETVSGTVDFLRHYNNASDGAQSIDLLGTASATFQQTFTNLTPGQSYAFSIDYSGHSTTGSQADVLLDQGTGFQLLQTLSPVADSVSNGNAGLPNTPQHTVTWATFSHTFVATGTEATIRFVNTGSLSSTGLFIDNFVFEGQAPCEDFGDAPASYGTLLADNGARHEVVGYDPAAHTALLMLGPGVGLDPDGQPDPDAALDDFDDGVVADSVSLVTGATTASVGVLAVNATADDATLAGWIDFDDSGTFDTGERAEVTVPANTNTPTEFTLDWSGLDPIPADFQGFARFRIATAASQVASPVGAASDGEVEDYVVPIVQPAQITIIKLPTAQDGTIFPFTTTAEAPDDAFELSSDAVLSYTFSVPPGTVSVTETAVADWVISAISCVDESGNAVFTYTGAPGDPSDDFERGDDTVNITIDGGEATCTFTNAPTALPTLAKYFNTDPASDPPPAEPPVIPRGGTALLTFVIANTQPTSEDQTGLGFTDTLPPGLVLADGDSPPDALVGANTCGGTVTAQAGTAAITLAGGAVTANAECSFTVRVTTAP